MRVSDSERERVAQFLREQALEGRLDHEELEDRIGGAYRAKTAGDLQDLIEDLPHRRVAAAPAYRPEQRRPRRRQGPHPLAIAGMVLLALLVLPTLAAGGIAVVFAILAAVLVAVFVLGFLFGPFILIGLLISQAAKRRSRPRPQHWTPNWH